MFIDRARIYVEAGAGGDGRSSFRRENLLKKAARTVAMAVVAAT